MVIQSNMSHLQTIVDEHELTNENVSFHITRILQDHSRVENSINDLMNNLSVVIEREENMKIEMKRFTLEWSSFLVENKKEVTAMKQKMNSTAEDSKDLKFLIDASNVSCETNIKALKTSMKIVTADLSSVEASISNLQQDLNSSNILQERSREEIYNITNKVQELQTHINNSGKIDKIQDELTFLSEAVIDYETSLFEATSDYETRLTRISAEVTSIRANIASFQSNLNLTNNKLLSLVPVRLVGGSTQNEGRVEVWYSGTWGTVCDDSWDSMDAKVVCRMLGYTGYTAYGSAHFGPGSGTIWLDDVACSGSENSIFSCSHSGMGTHNCAHGEDASVRCT
ncbi:deleted in malignant brain tumors 1 protein-like isoform X1 [Saccostrea echinata]|uniref:deleted in malignant brain tumors 1 protein-like isoform X1 n=1 Tax=Saccostrea echinata TaxID=191078 RepID=UPI002A83E3BD|nr:deleted in malignant brain tumors 1 protein-like isoform X1 [Saccostrea echinata]